MSDKLHPASLQWDENGQPISVLYNDVYFSKASGIEETRYVFLEQNHLAERWQQLPTENSGHFTIAETGFGTGLNFLATAQLWLETAPSNWRLHFVSVEKYPLNRTDLEKALALWPELADLTKELIDNYPPPIAGTHRLHLFGGRISLTLLFGEAATCFEQMRATDHPLWQHHNSMVVDAWFLDGFAPSKNPEMWTSELFNAIGNLSDEGTTLATFTAAGIVRRGLQEVGFDIQKVPGFGHKREMVVGFMAKRPKPETTANDFTPAAYNAPYMAPWYLPEACVPYRPGTAIVIGGGIAGCSAANALARRGWQVTMIERHPTLASEASGNPQGIIYPKLSKQDSTLSRYGLYSLIYASRYYAPFWQDDRYGKRCGVLILPENEKQQRDFAAIGERFSQAPEFVQHLNQQQLSDIAGINLDSATGLYCPQLGWVVPPLICQQLSNHSNINILHADAEQLEQMDSGHWSVSDKAGNVLAQASVVIVASSSETTRFEQTRHLPLKRIRGQITQAETLQSDLKTVICGTGYIAPPHQGRYTLGATYHIGDNETAVREQDHHTNREKLVQTDAGIANLLADSQVTGGRVAFRCTTPDYLPIVGPAPDAPAMHERFALLAKNARAHIPLSGPYHQGLYISCGFGSRGLSYAPLAAELLASHICGEPMPVERELVNALNPARFLIRELKRK